MIKHESPDWWRLPSVLLAVCLGAVVSHSAHATWSIVAVDPESGKVGLAAATCGLGVHFIAAAVPGAGVVAAQAGTSFSGRDQAAEWMREGVDATAILQRLHEPELYEGWFERDFSELQYGVATLVGNPHAGFTGGNSLIPWSGGAAGDQYSVQGNTLRSANVVIAAAGGFEETEDGSCRLTFEERLLRALEAGRDAGGDKRCPENRPAHSAILLVASTQATTSRIVTPKEIGIFGGIYHELFPYEPDADTKEPIQHLREKYSEAGGRKCHQALTR